jgi:hypothetical protein
MFRRGLGIVLALVAFAGGTAGAHDQDGGDANTVAENRRDNIVPFFEAGDPRTRHDSDGTNDQTRDDAETRRSWQRWRDEVRNDGSTGEVGEGCMDQYCNSVSDDQGEILRVDHTLSVGPAAQPGDWNRVRVKALGAGATADLGGSQEAVPGSPILAPDVAGAALRDPDNGTGSPDEMGGDPDTEPEDVSQRGAPSSLHVNHSPDHSWLGAAHSSSDHGDESEFASHDTHGGTIWADVILPDAEDPTRVRDTKAGNSIVEHLSCPTCTDEYHEVWLDPERTIFQIGEAPGQTEHVGRNPDRWLFGHENGQPEDALNSTTAPASDAAFGSEAWMALLEANASATGVGEANSACCAPSAEQGDASATATPGTLPSPPSGARRPACRRSPAARSFRTEPASAGR